MSNSVLSVHVTRRRVRQETPFLTTAELTIYQSAFAQKINFKPNSPMRGI